MYVDSVYQLHNCTVILLIHYPLIQQEQLTACTGWGGYWINIWGKVGAKRANNQAAGSSKAYQQARNLQLHFQKAHGKIDHTQYTHMYNACTADDEVTSLHVATYIAE